MLCKRDSRSVHTSWIPSNISHPNSTIKEKPRRRITVTSSLKKISMDQLEIWLRWGGRRYSVRPHPFLQQAFRQKFKDDVNGFSSTWNICLMLYLVLHPSLFCVPHPPSPSHLSPLKPHHRLNKESDLKSLLGILSTVVLIGWDSATPPPPHLGSCTRVLLVKRDRRHHFVTPWASPLYIV